MSIEAVAWALRQQLDDPTSKLILISLADHHNASTGRCFPGRARLAEAGCCSERTVKRKLLWLREEGWISVAAHFTPSGRQEKNSYVLHFGRRGGGGQSAPLPPEAPENIGGQSDPLPTSTPVGGGHSSDPHEGDRWMSPLNCKKNGKKTRAPSCEAVAPQSRAEVREPATHRREEIGSAMKDLARSLRMVRIEGGR